MKRILKKLAIRSHISDSFDFNYTSRRVAVFGNHKTVINSTPLKRKFWTDISGVVYIPTQIL
ncbi:MAG: hypothetical protein F4Y78_01150 [Candidatus Dadabacteria bacterium]|nr:hypothetical protein [Candidatus Dadabacteria bacterium]MYG83522.1 hypothetical protein [Candidatus Dadabacteria bacterium]